jgi:protein involved in polysaccharide export with SLBB domain
MYKKLIILVLYLAATLMVSYAQDPSTVNVSELTDQQIQAIVNEVNARGLTLEQAAQMARLQGASPQQVEGLMIRIREMGTEEETTYRPLAREKDDKTLSTKDKLPTKIPVKATEKEKKIFGFQFFNSEKLTFEPPVNIPTPQNYVLGIGDELTIVVWGASQKTYKLKVESSGTIVIPDLGPVAVAGMEFVKAKEMIRKRLTAIYQGLGGATPNTWSEVTVSALRSISVHVIGEAKTPGTYTLPATASAFNALYLSGGPGENGSFRNIQVIRDNQVVKTIDVYNYLINGIMGENIQLREQDIINIPVYEKRITAMGSFKRTGFFELKEAERLSDLLRYTGGFSECLSARFRFA